jgi:integrase
MTRVRVKGFQIFHDRHGKLRCYHRATRKKIDLAKYPLGSAEFFAACAGITNSIKSAEEPRPGTLGKLIKQYRANAAFTDLQPRTKQDYQRVFDYLKSIDDIPLARFDAPLVVRIRDKATKRGRRFANYVKAVLSILFGWGLERGHLKLNPAKNVKNIRRPRNLPESNRAWTDQERHAVLSEVPAQMKTGIALMMFTGLGPKDALHLPKTFYRNGEIATKRSKTGAPVYWKAPAQLKAILAKAPKHEAITLCANLRGRPWTESGFRASWRKVRVKLEKEGKIGSGLTPYGLRHTVAVILREAGFDERTIADALGQKTIEMARHYAKGADLKPKMHKVVMKLDAELNKRRTKIVKPQS